MEKQKFMQKEDFARFQAFLKNEPVMAILNRNITFLLDREKRIKSIEINDKMESYTDGKKVVISGIPQMISPDFDRRAWILMMRVALAHEVQHDNSSDFNQIKKIRSWFGKYMRKNFDIREDISEDLAHTILNCLEDGRIDEIVVQRFPGYLSMMRMVNFAIRGEDPLTETADSPGEELTHFQNQVLSYSITGMNLPGITVYHGQRLEQEFLKVRGFIDEAVSSPTAQGCYDACVKLLTSAAPYIADLVRQESNIMDFLEKMLRENYSQSDDTREEQTGNAGENGSSGGRGRTIRINCSEDQQAGKDQDGEDESGKEGDSDDQKDGKDAKKEKSQTSENGNGSESGAQSNGQGKGEGQGNAQSNSNTSKGKGKSSKNAHNSQESAAERAKRQEVNSIDDVIGAGFDSEQSPPVTNEELDDMLAAAEEELRRAAEVEASMVVEKGTKTPLNRQDLASLQERYCGKPPRLSEVFITPTKQPIPGFIASESKRLHERLASILMKRRSSAAGYRKGCIAPNKLWRVGIGSDDIFQRKQPPKLSDCAVYELIDGSGSMSDRAYNQGGNSVNKLVAALTTASIMEEALKGLASTKVTIFRAGWGSDVEHVVVKDFNQKPIGSRCYDSMTVVGPSSGNMDGFSIRIAAMDLAKRPEKNKILLVLSDGLPSAYGNTKEAKADVRSAVKWARMHGITVISIMFGEESFLKSNYSSYKEMYEQDIIAVKPVNINREFEMLLSKLIK